MMCRWYPWIAKTEYKALPSILEKILPILTIDKANKPNSRATAHRQGSFYVGGKVAYEAAATSTPTREPADCRFCMSWPIYILCACWVHSVNHKDLNSDFKDTAYKTRDADPQVQVFCTSSQSVCVLSGSKKSWLRKKGTSCRSAGGHAKAQTEGRKTPSDFDFLANACLETRAAINLGSFPPSHGWTQPKGSKRRCDAERSCMWMAALGVALTKAQTHLRSLKEGIYDEAGFSSSIGIIIFTFFSLNDRLYPYAYQNQR